MAETKQQAETSLEVALDAMLLTRCHSGVENAIANLIRVFRDRPDCRIRLFLPPQSVLDDLAFPPHFTIVRTRFPVRWRVVRILWEQVVLPKLLQRQPMPDLLHAPGYIAPLAGHFPVILTVYDLIALQRPDLCRKTNALNFRLLLPQSIRRAAGIIVPSQATLDNLTRLFPDAAAKARIIPLGIGTEFKPDPDSAQRQAAVREKYGLPEKFILFTGQLEPKKNLPTLLAAFHRFRQESHLPHHLVLAGQRGWSSDAIDRTIRELNLDAVVTRTGFIPAADLPVVYRLASLFVFPSLEEGFGLPPLEAMACGTPVLVSKRGALPEIAGNAALLADPENIPELAQSLMAGLNDTARRQELRDRGLARSREFTWAKTAAATINFYQETLKYVGGHPFGKRDAPPNPLPKTFTHADSARTFPFLRSPLFKKVWGRVWEHTFPEKGVPND